MPEFSLHIPRFLRSRRSRRSDPPQSVPAGTPDDAAASQSPCLGPSPALSSRLSSMPSAPINDNNMGSAPKFSPQSLDAQSPIHRSHMPESTNSAQSQYPFHSLTSSSQQSVVPERQSDLLPSQHQTQGMFHQAHNLSATGNFIDGDVGNLSFTLTNNFHNTTYFMEKLLKATIPGAAADSSARDPPPRCHPGTRLAMLERCLYFITHCNGVQKMRWVVGAAGVGKSAIMQSVAESPGLAVSHHASVFFSINGRNDGTKVIMTLSYQFAAKSKLYRRFIEDEITNDPSLLQSSMPVQFEKFIVQPFIHNGNLNSAGRVLIIIDGLDECKNTDIQVGLLRLISSFCISYPSSPIAWLIASRPEPHIASFFSSVEVTPAYEKEEIVVDSDDSQADVERFIRDKLAEIGRASDFLSPQWPDEPDLWKLAKAAGGLFAYAHTAVRYIGDSTVGDPVSQLSDILNIIDQLPISEMPQEEHPMALLDALYARILSKVPPKIMVNARKLLLLLASGWDFALRKPNTRNFIVLSNWLGMAADEAYAAVNRLRSVLYFPQYHEAHKKELKPFHKSLIDYILRSDLFPNIPPEAQQIKTQCALRVLKEAPSGIDCGVDYPTRYGQLARSGGTGDKISITWQAQERIDWNDNNTRATMYELAIGEVVAGVKRGDPVFQSKSCIKLLTTQFQGYWSQFPCRELCNLVFDKSRRHEFVKDGILKQIPAKAIDISNFSPYFDCELQFHRLVAATTAPDPWNSSCQHERQGQWGRGEESNWSTILRLQGCTFCFERLERQLNRWIIRHPNHAVSIMFASAEESCVELRFIDLEDDTSEWTYWVWFRFSPSQLKELAGTK